MAKDDATKRDSLDLDSKADFHGIEEVSAAAGGLEETALLLYPLLQGKTKEELTRLNNSVVRKLDYKFLPCVTIMLIMCFLDRMNVANARLAGMQEDLNMTDVEWSAGISLFYVGHMITQVPGNVILARGNPRILLPACMLGWSIVTICMPAAKGAWSFILLRFLCGAFEGPFTPAVSLMTSSWYTKNETPLRMAIWHAGNIVSNVFSGLLAAAILQNMNGVGSISSWQWFILIEGAVSVIVALVAYFFLPKWPHNTGTYYLSAEESEMAQYRMHISQGGHSEDDEGTRWGGVILAAKDPITWLFAILHFFVIAAQSWKDFLPSIMATFNFSQTNTYLLQAPPYLFAFFACCAVSWSSGRNLKYFWHMVPTMALAIVGTVILIATLEKGPRYFSIFLLCTGPYVALNLQLSWETTIVPRPRTKRAALIAIANCLSNVTHWFTPYFFLRYQEPRYETGGGSIIVASGLAIFMLGALRWYLRRKNKKIDAHEAETGEHTTFRFVN